MAGKKFYEPEAFAGPVVLTTPPLRDAWDIETRFFCDWVTITQDYPEGGLPVVDAGHVMAIDTDGVISWKVTKAVQHKGSHDTAVNVTCDGHRVKFSGNVSRFGRPDNLFGFSLGQCLGRINELVCHYGLPPFTAGQRFEHVARGSVRAKWSGAWISRLDLTANYEAGSADNAHLVLQYLGTQHEGRRDAHVLGAGETVEWGGKGKQGRRRFYAKAYIKWLELLAHRGGDDQLVAHCKDTGIVRYELTARTKLLADLGAAFLGDFESGWAMGQLVNLFAEHSSVLTRAERATDDLDELPKKLRATARDYIAGMDLARVMKRNTFYTHRRELLPYGIDIAIRNVSAFKPRVRVVELARAEVPSWYQLAA